MKDSLMCCEKARLLGEIRRPSYGVDITGILYS